MSRNSELSGTFVLNKLESIHRWYSYIEGYSSCLVDNELDLLGPRNFTSIYDPFGGTGTTLLAASMRGMKPYFSETNPFMNFVTRTKINGVYNLFHSGIGVAELLNFRRKIVGWTPKQVEPSLGWYGFEKFFDPQPLSEILELKLIIEEYTHNDTRDILLLALSSILVECSKMIRRGDLRYAKPNEKKSIQSVHKRFLEKIDDIIEDINTSANYIYKKVTPLAEDCRNIDTRNLVDCVITSPPYLNGTNYIRNTKLELKLNDFISSESDLAKFHSKGIVAGINNVSKRNTSATILDEVKPFVEELAPIAYDKRIPVMVSCYFNDMNCVFNKLSQIINNKGVFIMDIGDSQFAGVHIPTHSILEQLCLNHGFRKYDEEIIRTRRSKNGMVLSQRILRFELNKRCNND